MSKPRILYISYDGMLEPLGQSQVIAYLEQLSDVGRIHLLSFEKPHDLDDHARYAAIAARLEVASIIWHPLTYHKSPTVPATLFDIGHGLIVALWLTIRHRITLIHARSYPSALIGCVIKLIPGKRLLFDMRGLWADERTDGGLWPPGGLLYRTVKWIEKSLLIRADHIVTLTEASRGVIEDFPYLRDRAHAPLSVIPTCADLARFRPGAGEPPQVFTLGYLGSLGTWYMFDEVLEVFKAIRERRPDARMCVINRNEHFLIRAKLAEHGIDPHLCTIMAVDHPDVPAAIAGMSVGTAIIKPVYSKIASAPTKLAEYLGCGVPCIGNSGVGDVKEVLEGEGVGVALGGFSSEMIADGVDRMLKICDDPDLPARCRAVAERHFSLDRGVTEYRAIYRSLLCERAGSPS